MATDQQAEFIQIVKRHLPQFFSRTRVIEMGSLDINGSVRGHFDAAQYVGVDLGSGPGVDVVTPGQMLDEPSGSYDCAISANSFEHNPFWLETFINMLRLVREGGGWCCLHARRPDTESTAPSAVRRSRHRSPQKSVGTTTGI